MRISMIISMMVIGMVVLSPVTMLTSPGYARIDPGAVVGVWTFDEGKGDDARDSSESGNDGKLVGGPKWIDGVFGKALEFDGVDDHVEVGDPEKFNFLTWTYVLWFRTATTAEWPNLVGREFGGAHGWTIHVDPNGRFKIRIDTDGGKNQRVTDPGNVRDDIWHHGAISLDDDSKSVKIYVDGEFKIEGVYNGDFQTGGGFLRMGAPAVGALFFEGMLDDVGLFSVVLEEEDIQEIMASGLQETLGLLAVEPPGKLVTTWARIKE